MFNKMNVLYLSSILAKLAMLGGVGVAVFKVNTVLGIFVTVGYFVTHGVEYLIHREETKLYEAQVSNLIDQYAKGLGGGNC